jgi:hypothetical protein
VPASVHLNATLAAGLPSVPAIVSAMKDLPKGARSAGVVAHGCSIEPGPRGLRLRAEIDMPALGSDEMVVVETADPRIWVSEAAVARNGQRLTAEAELVSPSRKPFSLDRSGVTLTILAHGRAVEISGCPAL